MKKRFIAGIVCPKCGAADSVRLHIPEGDEVDDQTRDCVACGYQESLAAHLSTRKELPTRVNKTDGEPATSVQQVEPQVLKIH